jgi:hypothetical protein
MQPRADLAFDTSHPDLARRASIRSEDDTLPDIFPAVPDTKAGVSAPCILTADPTGFPLAIAPRFMTESTSEELRIGCNPNGSDASTERIVRNPDGTDTSTKRIVNNDAAPLEPSQQHKFSVKIGLAQKLRGGIIMDVVTPEKARIAEEAGVRAIMAIERVPTDIHAQGGIARMFDLGLIRDIKRAVTIPVMPKARVGHFVETQIREAICVDYVDESEVLTLADDTHHINKHFVHRPMSIPIFTAPITTKTLWPPPSAPVAATAPPPPQPPPPATTTTRNSDIPQPPLAPTIIAFKEDNLHITHSQPLSPTAISCSPAHPTTPSCSSL